jgi:hypothetical protein
MTRALHKFSSASSAWPEHSTNQGPAHTQAIPGKMLAVACLHLADVRTRESKSSTLCSAGRRVSRLQNNSATVIHGRMQPEGHARSCTPGRFSNVDVEPMLR